MCLSSISFRERTSVRLGVYAVCRDRTSQLHRPIAKISVLIGECRGDVSRPRCRSAVGVGILSAKIYGVASLFQWSRFCESAKTIKNSISVQMIGVLIGSVVFGQLSDSYGRRKVWAPVETGHSQCVQQTI